MGRRPIYRDKTGRRLAADGVGAETLTITDIKYVDALEFANPRGLEQDRVHGDRSFIVDLDLGHPHPVQFGMEQCSLHGAIIRFSAPTANARHRCPATGEIRDYR